jgi:chromosome partitioning protein
MSVKFMVGNQKGGVAKTTSALTIARCLADRGYRTLLVDSDPQGSITVSLRLKPAVYFADFVMQRLRLPDCIVQASKNLEILCGNRETVTMEGRIFTEYNREHVFAKAFKDYEEDYDAIIVDVAPSISLLQACAMVMCRNILIPISMDVLSVSGAGATLASAKSLAEAFQIQIKPLALLPTIVNKRFAMTDTVMKLIHLISKESGVPVLEAIRTDQSISKAARMHQMLVDFDPNSKALEDYETATTSLLSHLGLPARKTEKKIEESNSVTEQTNAESIATA